MPPQPKQGTVPFDCPAAGKPCETWYKIFGDLSNGKTPLVGVHGGPGLSHNYMLCLQRLTVEHDIPVILYDQIGNGQSTHLQEKNGDLAFWNEELFHDELTNLLEKLGVADNYSYLGHSWGGMMGATFAAKQPAGLKKLILANAPASTKAWCAAYESYKALMPKEIKDVLDKGTATQNFETPEYKDAVAQFSGKFMMPYPWPQDLLDSFEWGEKDPTVYATGYVLNPSFLFFSHFYAVGSFDAGLGMQNAGSSLPYTPSQGRFVKFTLRRHASRAPPKQGYSD